MKLKFVPGKTKWSNFSLESLKLLIEEATNEINSRKQDEISKDELKLYRKMKKLLKESNAKNLSEVYDKLIEDREKFVRITIDLDDYGYGTDYPCSNEDCWCLMNPDRAGEHPDTFYKVIFDDDEMYCEMCFSDDITPNFKWSDQLKSDFEIN